MQRRGTMPTRNALSMRLWLASAAVCAVPALVYVQERPRPQPGTKWTDEQIRQAVAPMRAGRKMTPKAWPNGSKVAVCLSWDMDNESFDLAAGQTAPVVLSQGE